MDKLNLDKLSTKMQKLNLSEDDVLAMLDTPVTKGEVFIPTPLWVVYKKNNTIIFKDGVDLTMKPYIWGIRARRNLLISRLLAEDMPDAKAEWRKGEFGDCEFLPHYASQLDYQGREIVPAKAEDIYCDYLTDYDKTARILRAQGIDCLSWESKLLKEVDWKYWGGKEKVDATHNFICRRDNSSSFGTYRVKVSCGHCDCSPKNCWVPGRMALWIV